ncbi:hemolysin family protein [Halobacterium salinarum]|uniref:CNNM domain-containing protein n=1 Tax=Halobacterium salinarum TaxID=2242 RepID=UPI001F314ACD|nr:hemolysin family protein [Halobacterium salinarum]MCF2239741.1 hemolysin family protein [Halobacterium salinarum]
MSTGEITPVTALRIFGGIALLAGNGFFVATEFALTRVRQFDESAFQETAGLRRAWEMTDRLEIYLTGCQLGITVCSVGLGVVAEPALAVLFTPVFEFVGFGAGSIATLSVLVALAVMNVAHLVLAEKAPTYLGVERAKTVAHYCAPLHYWWTRTMSPIIRAGDRIAKAILSLVGVEMTRSWTEEEAEGEPTIDGRSDLRSQMGDLLSGTEIPDERREEVIGALDIDRIPVGDEAVPVDEVVAVSTTDDLETNLDRMADSPHVRYPLVGESMDDFRGVVYLPEVFRDLDDLRDGTLALEDVAHPPLVFDADIAVSAAIDRFQAERQELAFVTDPDTGAVVGMVTITDVLEAITGEVEDPYDEAAEKSQS